MKILAIEASAKAASCALYDGGRFSAYSFQDAGHTHSRTLMPMIRDMLANADETLAGVDFIAAAHGPGSFTGVRIGVSTALGLSAGCSARAVGVSTLAAMGEMTAHIDAITLAAMDARRNEVYAAAFLSGERLCEDCALPAAEFAARAEKLAKEYGKSIICIGDGAKLCYNSLLESGADVRLAPPHLIAGSACGVALAAARLLSGGGDIPPLRPVYLRVSQAERERRARAGEA